MSSIYLKVTGKKNWRSQNFDFLSLEKLSPDRFFGKLQLTHTSLNFKTFKSKVWEQNCVWLFYHFNFERNYDVLKSKSPYILLSKNINFNKDEAGSKMENPTHSFRETNLEACALAVYKNYKLKVKLWWAGGWKIKIRAFFVAFILSEGNVCNICVLSQCIVYWIRFQNIHTFTYHNIIS